MTHISLPAFADLKKKDGMSFVWTFVFVLVAAFLINGFDQGLSLIPKANANAADFYPGDANWDDRFDLDGVSTVFWYTPAQSILVDGDTIYVGGSISTAGSTRANGLAYYDGSAWQDMNGGITGLTGWEIIYALASSGDTIYAGGTFESVGEEPGAPANNIAAWSTTTGSWSALEGGVTGSVHDIETIGDDVIVSGDFAQAGGIVTYQMARWDGSAWNAFGGLGSEDYIIEMASDGTNLYVVGSFDEIGGVAASNIAYWDGAAWRAMGTADGDNLAIAAHDGAVYMAEMNYNELEHTYTSQLFQWEDSAWAQVGPNITDFIYDLAFSPAGILYVATQDSLAWWDAAGTSWVIVQEGLNDAVRIAFQGTDVILAGSFTQIDGVCASGIARWDGSAWSAIGGPAHSVNGPVLAVAGPAENDLYLGGNFTCVAGAASNPVAHWNGALLEPVGEGLTGIIYDLAYANERLYAVGDFTSTLDPDIEDAAYLDDGVWKPLGEALPAGNLVFRIAVSGDDVFINREAYTGLVLYNTVLYLDGNEWQQAGGDFDGMVQALAIQDGKVYAGGTFDAIGDEAFGSIAYWNGTKWNALGDGIPCDNYYDGVNTIAFNGSTLLVGGDFTYVGEDATVKGIAAWDGSSWSSLGEAGIDGPVNSIAVDGSKIYAAGFDFSDLKSNLVYLDGETWTPVGQGTNSDIKEIAVFHANIFAGGNFNIAGETPSAYFAWWHAPIIRGKIMDGDVPLAGVEITGSNGGSAVTNAQGNFILTGPGLGDSFSPSKTGYTFSPPSRQVDETNIAIDVSAQNFAATDTNPKPTPTPTEPVVPNHPAPTITSISPNENDTSAGVEVAITGSGFQPIPLLKLGGYRLTDVQFIDSAHLTAVLPALPRALYYTLTVTNPDGQTASLNQAFHLTEIVPVIDDISPGYGHNQYSNYIRIAGNGFNEDTLVSLVDGDDETALDTSYLSPSILFAYIPSAQAAAVYDVKVANDAVFDVIEEAYRSLANDFDIISPVNYPIWQSPIAIMAGTDASLGVTLQRSGGEDVLDDLTIALYLGDESDPGNLIGAAQIDAFQPDTSTSSQPVAWEAPSAGEYTIVAVIDPEGVFQAAHPDVTFPELVFEQTVRVLPESTDTQAPLIQEYLVNGGNPTTVQSEVQVQVSVNDPPPSSGIASLYVMETSYSQSSAAWVPVQSSGWIPFSDAPFPWELSPQNGMKYLQVWAADFAGNVSQPGANWINYIPESESIEQGAVRAYRYHLEAGQQLFAYLSYPEDADAASDADLYLWGLVDGDSQLFDWSDNAGLEADTITYTAPDAGMDLQLEVFGFAESDYALTVEILDGANAGQTRPRSRLLNAASGKTLPDQPAIPSGSTPPELVGLPAAPLSTTLDMIYLPLMKNQPGVEE